MSSDDAIARAEDVARAEGWLWIGPAFARLRSGNPPCWEVYSNAFGLGAKARVLLTADTGVVVEKGYVPR